MTSRRAEADVAVIGAGSSGLAALKVLGEHGIAVECFERGSDLGGLWRYENDNGLSGAYASLRTNVSRRRMQYPSFPMPRSPIDFPTHAEMAAYLDAYADAFGLRELVRFGCTIERMEPDARGRWCLSLDDGGVRTYDAVVVAIGLFWRPKIPTYPGSFDGEEIHSHDYRTPRSFAGRNVLVVGAGQSAAEIAVEVARVAARTFLSVRGGHHVIPRWIGNRPYDAADVAPLNRMPWGLMNRVYGWRATRELGPVPASWPVGVHGALEGIPVISSDLLPSVLRGDIEVKPAIERLLGGRVRFVDGSEEAVDRVVYATGYRISLPFLSSSLVSASGRDFPLYRRIVAPGVGGLFFVGFVDAPGGLLPVVEAQAEWIAAVLTGALGLPSPERMRRRMDRAERRTPPALPRRGPPQHPLRPSWLPAAAAFRPSLEAA
jgi:Flavin-binding monooxygenase-like